MRTAMVTKPFTVEIVEKPVPKYGPDDVLIKVKVAGVCGSDLQLYRGTHPFRQPPAVLGHEVAGDVIAVGSNVTKLQVGNRVAVLPHIECGTCEFCQADMQNLCVNKTVPGTPKWEGTFAEYFSAPEAKTYKIADGVSYEMGALVEPLAVAVHAVSRVLSDKRGSIAILGCGTIGLLTLMVAKEFGYKRIYCTDTAPFNNEMALKCGANMALNPLETDAVEAFLKDNGGGMDVTFVAAGSPDIINHASRLTKRLGEIVLISMITKDIPVYTYGFVYNEQTLRGAMTYRNADYEKAMELINGGLDLSMFVTQNLPLSEAGSALEMLNNKSGDIIKIMINM
ncbi:MAG: alcohol dehydrogenase catalytic domain-containing protein [Clostridiales bacterium]|nr:alcohol dehydrogenase catalytic domain-containing protein [Clostridiales bacterium]